MNFSILFIIIVVCLAMVAKTLKNYKRREEFSGLHPYNPFYVYPYDKYLYSKYYYSSQYPTKYLWNNPTKYHPTYYYFGEPYFYL